MAVMALLFCSYLEQPEPSLWQPWRDIVMGARDTGGWLIIAGVATAVVAGRGEASHGDSISGALLGHSSDAAVFDKQVNWNRTPR